MIAQSKPGADGNPAKARRWRIDSAAPGFAGQLAGVWRYRHLFSPLCERAFFNVHRNAILGSGWMAIQPLAIAIPAAFVLGSVFGVSVDPLPLPLFVLVGLAAWTLFRRCVQWMTKSLAQSRSLLQRVHVPPLLLIIAAASPGIFQLVVVLALVAVLAAYYGPISGIYYARLGWHSLLVLPATLMSLLLAIGISCFTSLLNAIARDTWLTLRYVLSGWMLLTPVFYPVDILPPALRWIARLNPVTPLVEMYRWALLGYGSVHWPSFGLSSVLILAVLIGGIWFLAKQQDRIFDSA